MGQTLIHGERLVRGREHLADSAAQNVGHILAAVLLWHIQTGPAAFFDLFKCFFKTFWGVNDAVLQTAALPITDCVQRCQHFGGQLAGFFENGRGEIRFQLVVAGG